MLLNTRATGQPIWVLVSILLAVIVAVTMFQIMEKGNAKDIDGIMKGANEAADRMALVTACKNWMEDNWRPELKPLTKEEINMEAYALRLGLLTRDEFLNNARFGRCDCVIFLHSRGNIDLKSAIAYFHHYNDCGSSKLREIGCKELCGSGDNAKECRKNHECED